MNRGNLDNLIEIVVQTMPRVSPVIAKPNCMQTNTRSPAPNKEKAALWQPSLIT
jgi:hypothetical protein